MEVKLHYLYIVFGLIFSFYGPYSIFAEGSEVSDTKYDAHPVVSKLRACKIKPGEKGDTGSFGIRGVKGDKGDSGYEGEKGCVGMPGLNPIRPYEKATKGDSGESGDLGEPGPRGDDGEKGDKGYIGVPGAFGEKGERGDVGPIGMTGGKGQKGVTGAKGEKGEKGNKGVDGPHGLPGLPGTCPCNIVRDMGVSAKDEALGTIGNPLLEPCHKQDPAEIEEDHAYFLGIREDSFEVFCKKDTMETCIRGNSSALVNYTGAPEPFWLNEVGFNIRETLQLRDEHLSWLREQSISASQLITYRCINSVPFSKDDSSKSVELLTWNDAVIGPSPTDTSPLFYSVLNETDHCSKADEDEESFSIIYINNTHENRLPINDIRINDIRNIKQFVGINVELCFKGPETDT